MEVTLSKIFKDAHRRPPGPGQCDYIVEHALADLSLRIRRIADIPAAPNIGCFVLIAVGVYSLPDLELLDSVLQKSGKEAFVREQLEVLNMLTCSQADLEARIPGIGRVFQTPVIAIWQDSVILEKAWGHKAVETARRHYGVS